MPFSAHCAAPAKINLALHVTGQTADGYHMLESLVAFCPPADELTLEISQGERATVLETGGPFASKLGGAMLHNDDNLILKAASLLEARFPAAFAEAGSLRFTLEKNLPVASGMGGGSADAAATLLLLRGALGLAIGDDALTSLAAELGSDVPMCLPSAALIARGRGTRTETVRALPPLDLVLINPGIGVSTPEVFAALRQKHNPPLAALPVPLPAPLPAPLPSTISARLNAAALVGWLAEQRNDLQPPALARVPAIGEALSVLRQSGAMLSRMSGSGATCFGIFSTSEGARKAAAAISASRPGWWVTATQTTDFGMDRIRIDRE